MHPMLSTTGPRIVANDTLADDNSVLTACCQGLDRPADPGTAQATTLRVMQRVHFRQYVKYICLCYFWGFSFRRTCPVFFGACSHTYVVRTADLDDGNHHFRCIQLNWSFWAFGLSTAKLDCWEPENTPRIPGDPKLLHEQVCLHLRPMLIFHNADRLIIARQGSFWLIIPCG